MKDRPSDEEWAEMIKESVRSPGTISFNGHALPGYPPNEIQISTGGSSGVVTMSDAMRFANFVTEQFQESALFSGVNKSLLDFGVGWGRVARCFLRDFRPENMIGIDVNDRFVKLCRDIFQEMRFETCQALPPTSIPSNSIDFIVGYSVLSHLSEECSFAWVREFARVLKPGGMAALTTRNRDFISYAKKQQANGAHGEHLRRLFPDYDEALTKYDAGQFLFSEISGHYGEAFIPEAYARTKYAPYLRLTDFATGYGQPVMVFHKVAVN
jgi:ubiquinone/menaquinone biosynthesis C-methylase UbiE